MIFIIFIAVLAILILSHEFGHFIFAKKAGLRVDEFGFGFPPKIFGVKRGGTLYSFNALPLGGFVKIYGEDGQGGEDKKSFSGQPIRIRALILAAGVFFNLLLAWPFLTASYIIGAPISAEENIYGSAMTEKGIMIIQVQEKTPAEQAGLKTGDYLLQLASKNKETLKAVDIKQFHDFIQKNAGSEITINYLRGKKEFQTRAIPAINPEPGKGSLGIAMDKVGIVKLPFFKAVWEGLKTTVKLVGLIAEAFVNFFRDIFTKREMLGQIAGPVGIAGILNNAMESGFTYIFQLIAVLSINLALINIIPFPALDGGRLLFLAIEAIKGSAINQKTTAAINNIGFAVLISLMLLVTYRDIIRLF
jgi:regulator of sigma E protease